MIWSASAVKSQWVRAEADLAREAGKLVQLRIDGALLPLPFNQIQCADLTDWSGDADAPGWRKVTASIAELFRGKSQLAEVLEPASTSSPQAPTKPSLCCPLPTSPERPTRNTSLTVWSWKLSLHCRASSPSS